MMFKKADFYLIAILTALCAVFAVLLIPARGDSVVITVDGAEYCRAPLSQDADFALEHATVCIEGGKVFVREADCPDLLCVHQGAIDAGSLVCLPNRIVVRVVSDDVDAVTGR